MAAELKKQGCTDLTLYAELDDIRVVLRERLRDIKRAFLFYAASGEGAALTSVQKNVTRL